MSARRLRLLVPSSDGSSVLSDGCDLPTVEVDVEETTMVAAHHAVRELGLGSSIVDCVVDQTPEDRLAGVVREAVVQLGPIDPVGVPAGRWVWSPWDALAPRLAPTLMEVCLDRIGELREGSDAHPLRAPWATEGWYERVSAWIETSLAGAGRSAPDAIVPYRHWGISAVLRVEAPDGRSWCKASYPPFRHEPGITAVLDRLAGGVTPSVVAIHPDEAWMLTEDLGSTTVGTDDEVRTTINTLVALQLALQPHLDELAGAGCPVRGFDGLAEELAEALGTGVAAMVVDLDRARVERWIEAVRASVGHISSLGFPEVLVHGDLHPGNVAATGDGVVIFDWSDACISSPVVDLAVWAWWYEEHADRTDRLWGWFANAWSRVFGVEVTTTDRRAIEIAVAAFHAVSYVRIVGTIEPHRRIESADGISHFVEELDRAVGAR